VFGVRHKLNGRTAQAIYDQVAEKLAAPEFRPRALFERFNIEVLCTTDSATDPLERTAPGAPRAGRDASCRLSARTSCSTCKRPAERADPRASAPERY